MSPLFALVVRSNPKDGVVSVGGKHHSIGKWVGTGDNGKGKYTIGNDLSKHVDNCRRFDSLVADADAQVVKPSKQLKMRAQEQIREFLQQSQQNEQEALDDCKRRIAELQEEEGRCLKRLKQCAEKMKCLPNSSTARTVLQREVTLCERTQMSCGVKRLVQVFETGFIQVVAQLIARAHADTEKTTMGNRIGNTLHYKHIENLLSDMATEVFPVPFDAESVQLTTEAIVSSILDVDEQAIPNALKSIVTKPHLLQYEARESKAVTTEWDSALTNRDTDIGVICIPVGNAPVPPRKLRPNTPRAPARSLGSAADGRAQNPAKEQSAAGQSSDKTSNTKQPSPSSTLQPEARARMEFLTPDNKHMTQVLEQGSVYTFSSQMFHRFVVQPQTMLQLLVLHVERVENPTDRGT